MKTSMGSPNGYELVSNVKTHDPDEGTAAVDDPLDISVAPPEERQPRSVEPRIMRSVIVLALVVSVVMGGSALWEMWTPASWTADGFDHEGVDRSNLCDDAYSLPGYIWRGKTPTEIRWIPHGAADAASLATEGSAQLVNDSSLPEAVLARAPRSFNAMLEQAAANWTTEPRLDFMRNKTVVLVGDSHDRKNIEGFCEHHKRAGARIVSRGGHIITRCEIPALDFKLVNWFHYGMPERNESWYGPTLSPKMDPPPYAIEDRLASVFLPDLFELGIARPNLLILNSVYWDLRYFARKAEHEGWSEELRRSDRPLSWIELEWHRARLVHFVELFRRQFPGVPMMYRPAQLRANNYKSGNVAIFQINESADFFMQQLGVPIFPWSSLLIGEEDYADDMHVNIVSQATYLHGDMLLYYLQRVVVGNWHLRGSGGRCSGRFR